MATLSDIRTRVRVYIDEASAIRWSDSELNALINASIEQVQQQIVAQAPSLLETSATVTAASGVIDTTSQSPISITGLVQTVGANLKVQPLRPQDEFITSSYSGDFTLFYVPRPTPPSADSDAITYGPTGYSNAVADDLVAVYAARRALIKDNELRSGLEALKQELEGQIVRLPSIPSYAVIPMSSIQDVSKSVFMWAKTAPNTIQLCLRPFYSF